MAGLAATIAYEIDEAAVALLDRLEQNPPTTQNEWNAFYREMYGAIGHIKRARNASGEALDIARENGIVDSTGDPLTTLRRWHEIVGEMLDDDC